METITKAIWGNGHRKQSGTAAEEPAAGVIGNTDSSDPTKPYDAGNDESAIVDRTDTQRNPDLEHERSSSADTSEAIQKEDTFIADSTTIRDGQNVNNDDNAPSNTADDTLPNVNINSTPHTSAPSSSNAITTTARDDTVNRNIPRITDSTALAPPSSSDDNVAQKQQDADRPSEDPADDVAQTQAIKETKREEEGISTTVSDEQQSQRFGSPAPTPPGGPTQHQESKSDTKDTKHESLDQGIGEKYVKSTGLAADGGDFDATRPGAGREAERLLEESGIYRDPVAVGGSKGDAQLGDPLMAKKGLGERLKEKIHPHGNNDKSEVNGGEKKGLGERVKEKIHLGKH